MSYVNKSWLIANWTISKRQWNLTLYTTVFIQENVFENVT